MCQSTLAYSKKRMKDWWETAINFLSSMTLKVIVCLMYSTAQIELTWIVILLLDLFYRGIIQATSSLFSRFSRDSIFDSLLHTRFSILDTQSSRVSSFEDRVSILDLKETVNLHLSGTVWYKSQVWVKCDCLCESFMY